MSTTIYNNALKAIFIINAGWAFATSHWILGCVFIALWLAVAFTE